MSTCDYTYDKGNKLEERNTYFYTEFNGQEFLDGYQCSRQTVLDNEEKKIELDINEDEHKDINEKLIITNNLLDRLLVYVKNSDDLTEIKSDVSKIIQRFEVSKRIHRSYTNMWRPNNIEDYLDYNLYIKFATLMTYLYEKEHSLVQLNALLKVIDSLISIKEELNDSNRKTLGWLITKELSYVNSLKSKLGIRK